MSYESISVIGLGYIGLPTAALIASRMHNVTGVDVSEDVVHSVNTGIFETVEPGLADLLAEVTANGWLRAVTVPEPSDVFIIAVPTPITAQKKPDLSYVKAAVMALAPVLHKGVLVILESTSPVGTTELVSRWLAEVRPDLTFPHLVNEEADVQIAYCPERIMPGRMLEELVNNDRIVGGLTKQATAMATDIYKIFVKGRSFATKAHTAEMCKLAENSFRDVNIAFANELSMICDKLDIDVWELIKLANQHPRVNILHPACGVGGHCVAVDPWFIINKNPNEAQLIRGAREVNDRKPIWVLEKIKLRIEEILRKNPHRCISDVTVTCLGVEFKPDTNDVRESPALYIAEKIAKIGCKLLIVTPCLSTLPKIFESSGVEFKFSKEILRKSDVVCVLVRHSRFVEFEEVLSNHHCVIDFVQLTQGSSAN